MGFNLMVANTSAERGNKFDIFSQPYYASEAFIIKKGFREKDISCGSIRRLFNRMDFKVFLKLSLGCF